MTIAAGDLECAIKSTSHVCRGTAAMRNRSATIARIKAQAGRMGPCVAEWLRRMRSKVPWAGIEANTATMMQIALMARKIDAQRVAIGSSEEMRAIMTAATAVSEKNSAKKNRSKLTKVANVANSRTS